LTLEQLAHHLSRRGHPFSVDSEDRLNALPLTSRTEKEGAGYEPS
jgi:hypothetical protein